MKVKVLIVLSLLLFGIAAYFVFQTVTFRQALDFESQRLEATTDSLQYYRYVSMGDSLMIAEDFDGAMEYFRQADLIFDQDKLQHEMQAVAEGVRSKTENISKLRRQVLRLQKDMKEHQDSLQEALYVSDSLMRIAQGEISLYAYKNQFLQDSLSQVQAAYQKMKAQEASVGKAEFMSSGGIKIYYAGDVSNGRAHGHGYGLFASGGIYEGEWKNNQRHGEGKYIWKDGNVYIGDYQNDQRHGTGTYYFSTGEKYVGEWKDNLRSGSGTLYGENGEVVLSGKWKNDQIASVEGK